ncbi:MAG: Gfo/Idh/MocA family oxidoreductase [Armatimonadetes bacterium]|nr:Gfo/Idh/MocA family oxidoreductase [Armatimonadota bacterium]
MIRLGICDCDTSHAVEFTKRLNHVDVTEEQWVDGAMVVAAYPGTSEITEPERVRDYVSKLASYGVEIVDQPEQLIGKVDGVLIESQEGAVHRRHAELFLNAGLPCFIDKPFTCSASDAAAIAALAERKGLAVFSSSSLRYALEVQQVHADAEVLGGVLGADAYSPAPVHPRNPGLFHYGIHGVETLYALMGPGCEAVWCIFAPGAETVVGMWRDERLGVLRGTRDGAHAYGFTAFCEKAVRTATIDTAYIYRELLKRVVQMFATGEPPLDVRESVELVAFIEAAMTSAQLEGKRVEVCF